MLAHIVALRLHNRQPNIQVLAFRCTSACQTLHACAQDREVHTSRAAVRALAHIVLSVESIGLIESLMDLLTCGDSNVVSEVRGCWQYEIFQCYLWAHLVADKCGHMRWQQDCGQRALLCVFCWQS